VFDIGPAEFLGLAAVALIVFRPDRLPGLAADAGRLVQQVRQVANGARHELREQLGRSSPTCSCPT
jgi:sec-independent protein translocase protein TatB